MPLPTCHTCSRPIYPWQRAASVGPPRHRRRDADWISHFRCAPEGIPAPARTAAPRPRYRSFHPRPHKEED